MKISHRYSMFFFLMLWMSCNPARADILILVHGWAANAETWIQSGVVAVLEHHGWQDAGVVTSNPAGVHLYPRGQFKQASHRIYRAQLPAEAPMMLQASHLTSQLAFIQQNNPNDSLIVAGHSAGGVVARLVAMRPDYVRIKSLITIAAPHLGTPRALDGIQAVEYKPFFCPGPGMDFLKTMLGGGKYQYLRDSRGAMSDLIPAAPGSLLTWMNQQAHPDIQYHAVIRNGYDDMVPSASQDLNQVPALRGRARTYYTSSSHALNPADGKLLADILARD